MIRAHRRTLRGTQAVATALSVTFALTACSGDTDPGAQAEDTGGAEGQTAPEGPFAYEDGRGHTVELEQTPTNVVAQSSVAAALWDAGYQVDGVYGELAEVDGELNFQAGNIDLSQVELYGETYGELDVEQLLVSAPELVIDYTFDGKNLWYIPGKQGKTVAEGTETLAIDGNYTDTDTAIESFVDLAGALGADTGSEDLQDDKEAYEAALEEIGTISGESDLQVAFVSADADAASFYIANQDFFPEMGTLAEAGLDIVAPRTGKPMHFHAISPEQLPDYADADVILFDARTYGLLSDKLESIDTWTSLPAVEAGQVYEWYAAAPYSYEQYAGIYQEIADELAEAQPVD